MNKPCDEVLKLDNIIKNHSKGNKILKSIINFIQHEFNDRDNFIIKDFIYLNLSLELINDYIGLYYYINIKNIKTNEYYTFSKYITYNKKDIINIVDELYNNQKINALVIRKLTRLSMKQFNNILLQINNNRIENTNE